MSLHVRMVKMATVAGLLALFLLLCLVDPCVGNTERKMVVVFKGDKTEVPYEDKGKTTMRKPRAFRVPAFVGGVIDDKEFLAVMCDARYLGFSDWSFIEAAASTSYGDYKKWSAAEIFAKNTRRSTTHSVAGDTTAVMKGNKIFALVPNWDNSRASWVQTGSSYGWNPLMIVGTVIIAAESEGGGASIQWAPGTSLKDVMPRTVNGAQATQFIGGVGNGMVMKNGAIVFPIQIANRWKHVASTIMYSTDNGTAWIIGGTTPSGPSECSVVEWGEGKLLLTTRYDSGHRKVYESDNMGTSWRESLMFSQVWGNQPDRRGVGSQGTAITAPVDGKDILLFSHPLNSKGGYTRDNLQLWLSDGLRIQCVGTISEDGKGEKSGYSILANVGGNLYSLHEINPYGEWGDKYHAKLEEWDRVLALSPLPQFFQRINNTVRAWREIDIGLQTKGISTEGLVGYLGNSNSDDVWEDSYNCVNAFVKSGQRVDGGFNFTAAPGSGAYWPVGSQGQNQVYIFTKKQFTLAATVMIHATAGPEDVSLIGASSDARRNRVHISLGYTHDNKWFTLHSNNQKTATEVPLVLNKEYHIAITFASGAASVYVDGMDILKKTLRLSSHLSISHFFMGGIGKFSIVQGSSCTVKNVMLFNRALPKSDIDELTKMSKNGQLNEKTAPAERTVLQKKTETTTTTAKPTVIPTKEEMTTTTLEPTNVMVKAGTTTITKELTLMPAKAETTTTTEEPTNVRVNAEITTTTAEQTVVPAKAETTTTTLEPTVISAKAETTTTTLEPTVISAKAETTTTTTEPKVTTINTETTIIPEKPKTMTTAVSKESTVIFRQHITKVKGNNQTLKGSLHELRNVHFNDYAKEDNSAVVSFSPIAWMFIVCSFILLTVV